MTTIQARIRCPSNRDELAPNGRPVSENFRAWFRSSQVVDEAGRPLVVFHGTASDFPGFDLSRTGRNYLSHGGQKGFFFTDIASTASVYAEKPAFAYLAPDVEPEHIRFGDGTANIMPVYLSLQCPIVIETKKSPDKFFDYARDKLYERVARRGADGVIIRGTGEWPRTLYIAFDPRQIKSAIGNSGDFSINGGLLVDSASALDLAAKPLPVINDLTLTAARRRRAP